MASLRKRGKMYYASYYAGGKEHRRSLETKSYQVAKERLRNLESSLARGTLDDDLPTKTPLAEIVGAFAVHLKHSRTRNGVTVDLWYLRSIFGPVCPLLEWKYSKSKLHKGPFLKARCLEEIRTADISAFIGRKVQDGNIGPKTANRYRELLMRLFAWAMDQRGVRVPGGANPAKKVERFREPAPKIRFLTLEQIDEQLAVLEGTSLIQTMVAIYIYAGLRREEALWLTTNDVDLKAGRHGVIRVRAKTVLGESWEPKTKVNRAVPISSMLKPYLERYRPAPSTGHWFFPSPKGQRWDPDNFGAALRNANRTADLLWSCLDFRHTFGSQLAMKGESLYKISTLMGNSPEICRRHYATLLPESLVQSVEFDEEDEEPPPERRGRRTRHPHLRLIMEEDG